MDTYLQKKEKKGKKEKKIKKNPNFQSILRPEIELVYIEHYIYSSGLLLEEADERKKV